MIFEQVLNDILETGQVGTHGPFLKTHWELVAKELVLQRARLLLVAPGLHTDLGFAVKSLIRKKLHEQRTTKRTDDILAKQLRALSRINRQPTSMLIGMRREDIRSKAC